MARWPGATTTTTAISTSCSQGMIAVASISRVYRNTERHVQRHQRGTGRRVSRQLGGLGRLRQRRRSRHPAHRTDAATESHLAGVPEHQRHVHRHQRAADRRGWSARWPGATTTTTATWTSCSQDNRRRHRISRVYRNTSGTFTDISAGLTGCTYGSVAWGDYDNDGDLDILLTGIVDFGIASRSCTRTMARHSTASPPRRAA